MRDIPDVHVVIFGEGELRAPLEKQIKHLGLDKRILLPGFREDVLSLVKSSDLFVMSSVTEGLGSAVLDAMAMGLAVVGTRAGGIPEAVVSGTDRSARRTGGTTAAGRGDGATAQRCRALRRAYGEAGRARVTEFFGVNRLVEGTLAAYRQFGAEATESPSGRCRYRRINGSTSMTGRPPFSGRRWQASVQRDDGVKDGLGGVDEEAAIDLVSRVARLVIVGVIFDAEVDERNARLVKRAVIGLLRPVLETPGRCHRLVVAEEQRDRRPRRDLLRTRA